jgi:hypothetical protein
MATLSSGKIDSPVKLLEDNYGPKGASSAAEAVAQVRHAENKALEDLDGTDTGGKSSLDT